MPRPLQKCRADGTPYARPPVIDAAIEEAIALPAGTQVQRAAIVDQSAAGFVPTEVIIHLIRAGMRSGDRSTVNKLFEILATRCVKILWSCVPDSYPHAADIRDDTLSELGQLIARDDRGTAPQMLDYYEIRFDDAIRKLSSAIARRYRRRAAREVAVAEAADPTPEHAEGACETQPQQEPTLLSKELFALFEKAEASDQELLALRFFNGMKVESTDTNETTLATHYSVSGRTIRNRLHAALARLAALENGT